MNKRILCTVLGLWVAILPFLGFPTAWKNGLFVVSGVVIAILSFVHAKKSRIL